MPENITSIEKGIKGGGRVLTLHAEDRSLRVTLLREPDGTWRARQFVQRISDQPRIPGSTTALYSRAREYLQAIADRNQSPIEVLFQSKFAGMSDWMRIGAGATLYNWNDQKLKGIFWTAKATINPQSKKSQR